MKISSLFILLVFSLLNLSLVAQTGQGKTKYVSIKKKVEKPRIVWEKPLINKTIQTELTFNILACVKSESPVKNVDIYLNNSLLRGIKIKDKTNDCDAKIDMNIKLGAGENIIYIVAENAGGIETSESKTVICYKPSNKAVITWLNPIENYINQTNPVQNIKACINSETALNSVEIYLNNNLFRGYQIVENTNKDCSRLINTDLKLTPGENTIYIKVTNEGGSILSGTKTVKYMPDEAIHEKRIALVIGNSDYINAGTLKNPGNDATDIATALRRLHFDVELVTNAGYKDLGMAIDKFGTRVKDCDIAFFYYAGHGVQVKGENYLIPVDAKIEQENQVKYNCIDANQVLAYMESAESKVNIVVMDACRDNPFERSWKRSTRGQGLATMDAPTGSLIAYATQPGNTAADGTGKNGLYTSALLEYIENPGLSIFEVFMKVRVKVLKESDKRQQPWESSSLTQNVFLVK